MERLSVTGAEGPAGDTRGRWAQDISQKQKSKARSSKIRFYDKPLNKAEPKLNKKTNFKGPLEQTT